MTVPRPDVDVAVIGAGVIGCMTAREILSRSPETAVAVLERDAVGTGATRRSAGLHFPRGATARVRRMSAYSQDHYTKLHADHPELPIHALPMTVVATAAEETLREVYLDSAQLSPVDQVPGGQVRVPAPAAAWSVRGAQYADVAGLTQFLAGGLRERVTLREGTRVTALAPDDRGVVVRLGTGATLTAARVVIAPGPWLAAPAWRDLLRPLAVRVKKVVALHVDRRPDSGDHAVVFHDEDAFLLPLYDRGHWLFSYTCQEWDVDPDTVGDGVSADDLRTGLEVLDRYAPGLVDRCASGRVFCDAYGPAGEPVVSTLADRRLVFAGAANGSGYRLAPAIAAAAAELLHLPPNGEKSEK